jgi:chemotaxis protein methyltransferase CheR
MVAPLTKDEFGKFKDLIEHSCGIHLDDDKDYLVETRLADLANELGVDTFDQLFHKITLEKHTLLPKVIDLMTTNETYWFRDDSLWHTLESTILPALLQKLIDGQRLSINIWSAACSTGQELYSLKILLHELCQRKNRMDLFQKFRFLGTDISSTALFLAKNGKYNTMSLKRGLSDKRREQYFNQLSDSVWEVKPEVSSNITFQKFNLMDSFDGMSQFDFILCRNVLIYFSAESKTALLEKFVRKITKDGYFVMGAAESIFNYSKAFRTIECGKGAYYQPDNQ